jgi:hypothetical protein
VVAPLAPLVAPAAGAVAAAWAAQEGEPREHLPRALVSAYGAEAVRGAVQASSAVAVAVTQAGWVVAAVVLVAALPGLLAGAGNSSPAWRVVAAVGGGVAAAALSVLVAVPALAAAAVVARWLGARVGDLAWQGVVPTGQATALPGDRPLGTWPARALVAATAAGEMARVGWLDAVPVVGPVLAAWRVRHTLPRLAWEARLVAGWPKVLGSMQPELDLWLGARGLAVAGAWLGLPVAVMPVVLGGCALAVTPWVPAPWTAALVAAGGAGVLLGLVTLAPGLGALALGTVLGGVTPWVVAWWVVPPREPSPVPGAREP